MEESIERGHDALSSGMERLMRENGISRRLYVSDPEKKDGKELDLGIMDLELYQKLCRAYRLMSLAGRKPQEIMCEESEFLFGSPMTCKAFTEEEYNAIKDHPNIVRDNDKEYCFVWLEFGSYRELSMAAKIDTNNGEVHPLPFIAMKSGYIIPEIDEMKPFLSHPERVVNIDNIFRPVYIPEEIVPEKKPAVPIADDDDEEWADDPGFLSDDTFGSFNINDYTFGEFADVDDDWDDDDEDDVDWYSGEDDDDDDDEGEWCEDIDDDDDDDDDDEGEWCEDIDDDDDDDEGEWCEDIDDEDDDDDDDEDDEDEGEWCEDIDDDEDEWDFDDTVKVGLEHGEKYTPPADAEDISKQKMLFLIRHEGQKVKDHGFVITKRKLVKPAEMMSVRFDSAEGEIKTPLRREQLFSLKGFEGFIPEIVVGENMFILDNELAVKEHSRIVTAHSSDLAPDGGIMHTVKTEDTVYKFIELPKTAV